MKKVIILLLMVAQVIALGCSKTSTPMESASLNIVNAINGSSPLVTNFEPIEGKGLAAEQLQYYSTADQIPYGNSWESGSYFGSTALSLAQISDTMKFIWSGFVNLPIGSIHSLFVSGDTTSVDTLFSTDLIPYYPPGDSVAGVRFVNLIFNGLPIGIYLQGNYPSQSEFSDLAYRQLSEFKQYMCNTTTSGSYNFEIRDQSSGSLLATFNWSCTLQKNNTIVVSGSNSAAFNVFVVNDY